MREVQPIDNGSKGAAIAPLETAAFLLRPQENGGCFPRDAFGAPGLQDVQSCQGAHGGLIECMLSTHRPLLWVQDMVSRNEYGKPFPKFAFSSPRRKPVMLARVRNARDALWAMEEGVKAGLDVVGEITGTPKVLDFTATRRLELFSQATGVHCILVRMGPQPDTGGSSGARWRWRMATAKSANNPYNPMAPGQPRWRVDLLRARTCAPGQWVVESARDVSHGEGAADRLRMVSKLVDGDMGAGAKAPVETGAIIHLRHDDQARRAAVG